MKKTVGDAKTLGKALREAKARIAELEEELEVEKADALDQLNDRAQVVGKLTKEKAALAEALSVSQAKVASYAMRINDLQKKAKKS